MSPHAVRDHCLAPGRAGRYRSLFPDLPALEADETALHALGRPGGPCDLGVDVVDDTDAQVEAVWPFFGQFVAHDITADRSPVTHHAGPIRNFRAPRANHRVNAHLGPLPLFPDLMGFRPVTPERTVDWTLQIDVAGHRRAQRAKRIDARLPASLIALPTQISGSQPGTDYASLANRDLQRGQAVGLASGEAVARRLGVPPLTAAELGLAERGWTGETPLWLYVLKEAEVVGGGEQLGPVGGRVVGEVLVGIIDADPESFRSVEPGWQPTLPGRGESFGLADILVPPS